MAMVNLALIKLLLTPVSYNIDDEEDPNRFRFGYIEVDDESSVRRMVREGVIPWLQNFDKGDQERIVSNLHSLIQRSCDDAFFVELLANCYLPAPTDKGSRKTFIWMWEEIVGRRFINSSEEPCDGFVDDISVYRTLKYNQQPDSSS